MSYNFKKLNFYVEWRSSFFEPTFLPKTYCRNWFDSLGSSCPLVSSSPESFPFLRSSVITWFCIKILFISSCFLSYSCSCIFLSHLSCMAAVRAVIAEGTFFPVRLVSQNFLTAAQNLALMIFFTSALLSNFNGLRYRKKSSSVLSLFAIYSLSFLISSES